ncbi:MFS transporter [Paenibacillus psychroresistens]|uniref:MFS transporter n=1 Tax=Paenibacillus psychroresistens TaxID=1778678 RepID=UPI001D037D66|nr:MFS transporter [Paenibacillus psychroresistens]
MNAETNVSKMGLLMSKTVWNNFRWEFAAAIFISVISVVLGQFFIPLALRHGASSLDVGILTAAPAIGLLLAPFWASMIEKGNAKLYMFYPNLIGRMLIILPLIYPKPWVYVATSLVFHLLMGIQAPAYASIMTRIYPAELRGRIMGNVRVAMGALMIPLAYVIGRWIDSSGGGGPLILAAVTGVISIVLFTMVKEVAIDNHKVLPTKRATLFDQLKLIKENRKLALFFVATTFAGFGNLLASPLYQIIQVQKLELTNIQIGYARMVYFFCLLAAYLIMGWVIDRYSPKRAMFFGIAAYAIPPILYGLFGNYAAVIVAGGFQGIGDAIWDIGCMAYVFKLAPGREAVVFGLHLLLFGIRGTIAPLLSTSLIHSVSLNLMLGVAAICILIGCLMLLRGDQTKLLTGTDLS